MKVDVVLGLQWGDEGKGKIVDVLANSYPVIARFQGGPNAGHSLHFEGKKFVLHTVPSGVFRKNAVECTAGNKYVEFLYPVESFIFKEKQNNSHDGRYNHSIYDAAPFQFSQFFLHL